MASPAQIIANQQNSKLSTGPKTSEGKENVKLNAIKHGLSAAHPVLPHENPDHYKALVKACQAEFEPTTPHQDFLVDQIAGARWRLRRLDRIETEMLTLLSKQEGQETSDAQTAESLLNKDHANAYAKLERHRLNLERSYYRAMRELAAAQKEQNEAKREEAEKQQYIERAMELAKRRAERLQPKEGLFERIHERYLAPNDPQSQARTTETKAPTHP